MRHDQRLDVCCLILISASWVFPAGMCLRLRFQGVRPELCQITAGFDSACTKEPWARTPLL